MSKKMHGENISEGITSDGTSARTRPLSIQDIMLRREKKAASEAKKTNEGLQENKKVRSNHLEQGREYKSRKGHEDMHVEDSKKEKSSDRTREVSKNSNSKDRPKGGSKTDDLKGTPKVLEKEGFRDALKMGSKKLRPSIRDDDHLVGKDKGIHNSQKLSTSTSHRADESKDRSRGEIRARNGHATRSEYQKGPGKRGNDETVENDRMKDRNEKLQNETKRKDRSFDNEKSSMVDRPMFNKQDSSRFQVSKHSDRNDGRNEYAKPNHGEPRLKRRRSRSRDRDGERHGRSISSPPREQRHNYHGHDSGNYPPYYSMEKSSRRKHAEIDKQRSSGTGGYIGGSHHRSESRLGGYSPRKRKSTLHAEQATTKTSSPRIQSPEKKSATWDQPPVKADQSNLLATLQPTVRQTAPSSFKLDRATAVETILTGSSMAADSVQLTQATRPLRRLHIENLPDSATEDMLIGCLNDFLLSSGLKHTQRSKPCLSCTINKEKHQAFVEFLTPDDATAALSFDGRFFNGSALKIRRPKEYVEMANVAPKKPAEEITSISDVVVDSPHKIFIAGIASVISSEMLMEIVSAFGPLAAYRFLFNEELGGSCAFLEYADRSITSKACAGLNGMKLGGCVLTAVNVFPNPPAKLNSQVGNEASPFYGIPDNAKSLLEEPTKVLQLKDVFDREEYLLLSKSELEETLEDVRMECARFGAVKSVNVVEYPAGSDGTAEDNIVELEDRFVKIEHTQFGDNETRTKAGSECPVPNQSIDVPDHSDPTEAKDVDLIPGSQDQEDKHLPSNAALYESEPPVLDEHPDLDAIETRAALSTLQREEADHMVSEATMDEDKNREAEADTTVMDNDTAENRHPDPRTSEICSNTMPGDEAEKSGMEFEQQFADDVGEDHVEKVPAVETRKEVFVFEPGSILVEFLRKEAACMAAHSLHGRRFGNKTVSAGYAPHDLYLQKYPR